MSERIITVQYKTDNPYTIAELDMVKTAILDAVLELDDEANKSSLTITAMTEAEDIDARTQAVVEFLNNAEITSSLSITPEAGGAPITIDFTETTEG